MTTLEEMVIAYVAAWTQTDEGKRRALLEKCWADDGILIDPTQETVGREALLRSIESFQQQFAGHRFFFTSGVDEQHSRFRFTWALVNPAGHIISEGMDFGEVGPDGRLIRMTDFFGPPSAPPSSWPADLTLSIK